LCSSSCDKTLPECRPLHRFFQRVHERGASRARTLLQVNCF
jgi:hypothetical protein